MLHHLLNQKLQELGAQQLALILHPNEGEREVLRKDIQTARESYALIEIGEPPKSPVALRIGILVWTKNVDNSWCGRVAELVSERWPYAVFRSTTSLLYGSPSFEEPRVFGSPLELLSFVVSSDSKELHVRNQPVTHLMEGMGRRLRGEDHLRFWQYMGFGKRD